MELEQGCPISGDEHERIMGFDYVDVRLNDIIDCIAKSGVKNVKVTIEFYKDDIYGRKYTYRPKQVPPGPNNLVKRWKYTAWEESVLNLQELTL